MLELAWFMILKLKCPLWIYDLQLEVVPVQWLLLQRQQPKKKKS